MTAVSSTIAGWIGASAVLLAYILLTNGRVRPQDKAFAWLNVIGSVGLVMNGVAHHAWPSAVLNIVWLAVGAVAQTRTRRDSPSMSRRIHKRAGEGN